MDALSKFTNPGIAFLLTVVFGFWLSKLGRPYNGILFNIHKLIALGTVIVTSMRVYEVLDSVETPSLLIILVVVAAICVVILFASGAFLSIGNLDYETIKIVHNIALVLFVVAMGLTVYLT